MQFTRMSRPDQPPSPYVKANIVSRLFFWWLSPIFRKGFKKELEIEDLYRVLPNDESQVLGDKLGSLWDEEMASTYKYNQEAKAKGKKVKSPRLWRPIIRQFGRTFFFIGLLAFFEECFMKIGQSICLGLLIRFFEQRLNPKNPNNWPFYYGLLLTGAISLSSLVHTAIHHPYFYGVQHVGMKIRVATGALVYRKALRLSQASIAKATIGQMVNLLSTDVNRFDMTTHCLHYLWIGPIQTTIVLIILWRYFGPACLVGMSLFILFVPFQAYMGSLFSSMREVSTKKTDRRIRLMNEIVSGMRVIKLYAWEYPFTKIVSNARLEEVKMIKKIGYLQALNISLFFTSSKVIIFLTLMTYVLTNGFLTAEKVFVTLALYNHVRLIMTLFFPTAISQLAQTGVTIRRLEKFLLMEERKNKPFGPPPEITPNEPSKGKNGIWVEHLFANWNTSGEDTLKDINLKVESGELLGIIGQVGSGKGSILAAILGELPVKSGSIYIRGRIAYAAQDAIIFGGSVQDNITFGREFDPTWYDRVVEACALKRDFDLFPFGDKTLCGERGSNLSGGQRARINLARAVYTRADIYLLDDPLSAVDSEVGRHLYEQCINGILRNKARILITHQIQFLVNANYLLLLSKGEVREEGTYAHLMKKGIDFSELEKPPEDGAGLPFSEVIGAGSGGSDSSMLGQTFNSPSYFSVQRRPSLAVGESSIAGNIIMYEQIVESHSDHLLMLNTKPSQGPEKFKDVPKIVDEAKISGSISMRLFWTYLSAGTSALFLIFFIFILILTQICSSGSDYWLSYWTNVERSRPHNASFEDHRPYTDVWDRIRNHRPTQLIIYSVIIFLLVLTSIGRAVSFYIIAMQSSASLHNSMFKGLIRVPMRFFEVNPIGRILNRIAKDIALVDDNIPITYFDVLEIGIGFIGLLVIICIVNYILIIPSILISFVFYFWRKYYIRTARAVKRLETVSKSPVLSHLSASLNGISTIRAFKLEKEFARQFDELQDVHTSAFYLFLVTSRWFGIRLDWISFLFVACVSFSFFLFTASGPEVGLGISSVIQCMNFLQWGVRQSAELENQMVSVERILEYTKLEPEAPFESAPERKPPPDWPIRGEIIFNNIYLRYGSDEPVLKGLSFKVRPSEKIGIVGRTGAGKSSLITALFRIAEPSGRIEIDGVDISHIGLHDLREKLSIIPQDPVLFSGTLRQNLDPFGAVEDEEIWRALEDISLASAIKQHPAGLDFEVAEGGANFSVGQKQLICLVRAILKKNKILILDEATANVDPDTDALIQTTIRTKFVQCTVLTVAHRLNTIMDSDRILVMDSGKVKEFDEPFKLLSSKYSALTDFVNQTGPENAQLLRKMAKDARDKRKLKMILERDIPTPAPPPEPKKSDENDLKVGLSAITENGTITDNSGLVFTTSEEADENHRDEEDDIEDDIIKELVNEESKKDDLEKKDREL